VRNPPVHGPVKDDGVGRDPGIDQIEGGIQKIGLAPREFPFGLFLDDLACRLTAYSAAANRVAYDLCERGLTVAEEAGYPYADPFVRLRRGTGYRLVHPVEMLPY